MLTLLQDLRFGVRMLMKRLAVTLAAVLALAFGIGATSTIFSIVNAVLLRPLPYAQPDRLMMIWGNSEKAATPFYTVSPADWVDYRNQSQVFEQIGAFTKTGQVNLTGSGDPVRVTVARVSADFFPMLGTTPFAGRSFTPEEDHQGNDRVAILSYGFWQSRFGGDVDISGKHIILDGINYTVVGVMPRDFSFPVEVARGVVVTNNDIEMWTPLALPADLMEDRDSHFLRLIGRLAPGVRPEQAAAEMEVIAQRLAQQYPDSNAGLSTNTVSLRKQVFGRIQPTLILLLGAGGFVLLIACANVSNLLLARGIARKKEIAIRLALGAGRARLVRQFITESLLLGLGGGALGVFLTYACIKLLPLTSLRTIPRVQDVQLDHSVLIFTLILSLLTSIVFGLIPALKSSGVDLHESIKEGTSPGQGGQVTRRIQNILVVSEIALALVILTGAGLMVKSYLRILYTDPGFNPNNVLILETNLPFSKYPQGYQMADFYRQLLGQVEALPGVTSAGAISYFPFNGAGFTLPLIIEGRSAQESQDHISYRIVSSSYFSTLNIPLLEGRFFSERDIRGSLPVVLINESARLRYWPDEDPLGKRVKLSPGAQAPWLTVVGVVGSVRNSGLDSQPEPEVYEHYLQNAGLLTLAIHTSGAPAAVASEVRSEVWKLDKDIAMSQLKTLDQILATSLSSRRLDTIFFLILALIACVLAGTGGYAVISFSVTQRTREIGVRMALGARPRDVLKLVVGQGMKLAAAGILIGLAVSLVLTRVLTSLLYEVSATDPGMFLLATVFIVVIAAAACYFPARRAAQVDPTQALRYE